MNGDMNLGLPLANIVAREPAKYLHIILYLKLTIRLHPLANRYD